ncbi:nacht and wd domain protein [Fusarium avenaceum]|nr:nacht and wd domain protein [Fusarium avenaceum]
MCLGSIKFWPKRKKRDKSPLPSTAASSGLPPPNAAIADQSTSSTPLRVLDDSNLDPVENVAPDLKTISTSENLASAPQTPGLPLPTNSLSTSSLSTSKLSNGSTGSLQERLWNQAYANLKDDETTTVEVYESFLLQRSEELEPRPMTSPDDQTTALLLKNPDHMEKLVNVGLERSQRIARAKKNIEEFVRVAEPVKEVMKVVVQAAPQATIAWSCISFALEVGWLGDTVIMNLSLIDSLQIVANPLTESSINRDSITYVLGMMEWYWGIVDLLLDEEIHRRSLRDQVEKQIIELYQKLLLYQMKSISRYFRNQIYVLLRDVVKLDDWAGELKGVKDAEEDLRKKLQDYTTGTIIERLKTLESSLKNEFDSFLKAQQKKDEDKDNNRWVTALHRTNPIYDKLRIQTNKGELLRDSYRWVLDHDCYKRWEKDSSHHSLWIHGDPGKGKTMLLCGIIDELQKDPLNTLSYFFCQASEAKLNNATSVLRGLLYSLVYRYPQLVPYIRTERPAIGSEQFDGLNAWEALSDLLELTLRHPHLHGAVLLLDALDECVDIDDRRKLLEFFRRVSSSPSHYFKLIVTSRGWQDIRKRIGDEKDGTFMLSLEENAQFVSTAVTAYIDREVQYLARVDPYKREPKILMTVKNYLLQNAQDTFLWVALVCKELNDPQIEEDDHVSVVLRLPPPGLDGLYKRMLSQIPSKFYSELCVKILEVMSVLKRAITLKELVVILDISHEPNGKLERLETAIRYCGSMLNVQKSTVYFVHQSAVDFLTDQSLQGFRKIADRHSHVFSGSLRALTSSLSRDMYGLEAPDIHRDDIKTPEEDPLASLKYSCVYWIEHLSDSDFADHLKDNGDAHRFFQEKFLFWIEAMSLLHEIPQATQAIQKLQKLVERTSSSAEQSVAGFLDDANRFLLFHRRTIEEIPLQLYASALVFSPKQSIVKARFQKEAPKWVTVAPGLDPTWSACLQTLEDHEGGVCSTVYSHDGQWLVSGSRDLKVKLWHAGTGTCIRTVDGYGEEHSPLGQTTYLARVISTAFSADDGLFISGSSNGVIKIWDRTTGSCIRQLETQSSEAMAMAFSSDGCTAVSALRDGNIIISKIKDDIPSRIVKYHEPLDLIKGVVNVALTANGKWAVVAFSLERTINIVNTSTEEMRKIPIGDESYAVAWSADGDWVASGGDHGVQIREKQTGQLLRETNFKLPEINPRVQYMSFSADKILLAAGSSYDISVWNTTTGALAWRIDHANTRRINSISFSPDAKQIVLSSYPRTIQLWDLSIVREAAYHDFECSANELHFSDKDHFIGECSDGSMRMWGNTSEPSTFHGSWSAGMALSQDNQRLASSGHNMITVWDVKSVKVILRICGGAGHVSFDEHDLQVTSCNACTQGGLVFNGGSEGCYELAFRDNCELAASFYGLIKIWNTVDGSSVQNLDSGTNSISNMTFSNNGRLLACVVQNFETFNEPGKKDAATGNDQVRLNEPIIQIWDTATEQCLSISLTGTAVTHYFWPRSLSFSADMQLIAAAADICDDKYFSFQGICCWDVKSGSLLRIIKREGLKIISAIFDTKIAHLLHTEYGYIDVPSYLDKGDPGLACDDSDISEKDDEDVLGVGKLETIPAFCGYGLSYDRKWIVRDGKRLLWLHPDFQPGHLNGKELTPVIDGLSIAWMRVARSPVRMCFMN